ncbi:MAG: hypothetical protein N3G80_04510 [Candidatus Micrarchaeota archaeon]|nr:hypothetical protein [Candidatus Micrarchaeota archaeon]
MAFSEKDKLLAFVLLVLISLFVTIYAVFFFEPPKKQISLQEFLDAAYPAQTIALFLDARGADEEAARKIYQCGTDLAGGRFLGSKEVETYGCDDKECVYMGKEGAKKMTLEQIKSRLRNMIYIQISFGAPSTKAYENRLEIRLDSSYNQSCKIG